MIYKDGKKIRHVYHGDQKISYIYRGSNLVWTEYMNFSASSWEEIARWIEDGTWADNRWKVGMTHSVEFKDGTSGLLRIIGINDGHTTENFQVDKDASGNPVHMTLELTTCLPDLMQMLPSSSSTPQTWRDTDLRTAMQPGGTIYENLPDELQSMIIPVVKKSGQTLSSMSDTPIETTDYLFIPAIYEYVGTPTSSYNINANEGIGYEYYVGEEPGAVQKVRPSSSSYLYYWTRSAATFPSSFGNYFWGIGSATSFSFYSSSTKLGVTFALCI